jgi:hypothetical protein
MRWLIAAALALAFCPHTARAASLAEVQCAAAESDWTKVGGGTDVRAMQAVIGKMPKTCTSRAGAVQRLQAVEAAAASAQGRPHQVNTPSLTGTWRGTAHQIPAGAAGSNWSMLMTIDGETGSIRYPSLHCGGTLTFLSGGTSSAQYRESITYGESACITGGVITASYSSGQLAWSWSGQSGGQAVSAVALLTRQTK